MLCERAPTHKLHTFLCIAKFLLKNVLTFETIPNIITKQSRVGHTCEACYGVLAQLGEHLPYKQRVIGSSPIGPIPIHMAE